MRVLFTCAWALLLIGAASAQSANDTTRFSADSKNNYTFSHPNLRDQLVLNSVDGPALGGSMRLAPSTNEGTCWFIRSYNFEREDGEAPELKDVTTCTPSHKNELRRAKKRGAGFVPLVW